MRIFEPKDVLGQIPRIIFRRRIKFLFELVPFEAKGLSLKKIFNFFVAGLNQYFLPSKPLGYPVIAQVEPTNFCNLHCPLCYTASETKVRPKCALSLDTFKDFVDEVGDYLLLIILWNWGEPFLNPDIFKIISYAKSKNIFVHTSTNGNVKFDREKADMLVDSGLDSLIFAVDGATQETYSKYRKGGNLETVLANIRAVVEAKKRKNSKTPLLNMRFVVMQHNEKELPRVKQLAKELDVDFFTSKTVNIASQTDEKLDNSYAPDNVKYRRHEYKPGTYVRKHKSFECMRPWKRITLDSSGEVIACEYDYKNTLSFGNIDKEKSSMRVWKGKKARAFRKGFNYSNNNYCFCKECGEKDAVTEQCIIERINIKSKQ